MIWESKLGESIGFFSDSLCQGRGTGTSGAVEASFQIIRTFRKAGLMKINGSYAKHIYAGNGNIGHNIIGMIPGFGDSSIKKFHAGEDKPAGTSSDYIIIGAHYDNLGSLNGQFYPGADANASGIVAMTSLAEMISARKKLGWEYPYSFMFVAFDANKKNLAGANGLWNQISQGYLLDPATGERITPDKIRLMVNIDQIGSSLTPVTKGRNDYLIMLGNESLPERRRPRLAQCNRMFDINLELCFDYYGSKNFTEIFYTLSDQKPFVMNGIPSVLFTSGITMNTNRTYDRPETIDLPVLKKRIYLIFHWLENIL